MDPEAVSSFKPIMIFKAMKKYRDHRLYLGIFLCLNMVFEVLLYSYLFKNMDFIISQLSEIYRDLTVEKLQRVFIVSNLIDIIVNIFMYGMGFLALKTHKVTVYNSYHWVLMLSIFSRIVISYLNM